MKTACSGVSVAQTISARWVLKDVCSNGFNTVDLEVAHTVKNVLAHTQSCRKNMDCILVKNIQINH